VEDWDIDILHHEQGERVKASRMTCLEGNTSGKVNNAVVESSLISACFQPTEELTHV